MSTPFSKFSKKFNRKGKHSLDDANEPDTYDGNPATDPFFFGDDEDEHDSERAQPSPETGQLPVTDAPAAPESPSAQTAPAQPAPVPPVHAGVEKHAPSMADSGRLIDMRGIVKTYNEGEPSELTVLHGIDFYAEHGEFVSIVGPSGCGKSTLMNLIGMLDRPSKGGYAFNGEPVYAKEDKELAAYRSQNIGFIFQNFNLIGRIDALQNVAMPMMYAGVERQEREERAAELLDMMGMGDRLHHNPNELSGGQKQRVAIARSLANDPDLLLADEPTGALDSKTGRMVMDLFHKLHDELGKSVVFITHNPELAEETGRIVEMMDGRIDNVRVPSGLRGEE